MYTSRTQQLLDLLNIQHPILLSPMAGVTTPQLAAEVSQAGGLGALGLGASNIASCQQQIAATQALTARPFQVNFFCHQPEIANEAQQQAWIDYIRPHFERLNATPPQQLQCIYPSFVEHDDFLDVVIASGVKIVSFHFGIPTTSQLARLKQAKIISMATATNVHEAQCIQAAGVDVIIAQGVEAGGHRGSFHAHSESGLTTQDVLQQLLRANINLPIVAAGGIATAQDIQHFLTLGASAVQMGTRFIPCPSSNASTAYRHALQQAQATQLTSLISGRNARGIVNQWHGLDTAHRPQVAAYPYAYDLAKQLHAHAEQHGSQQYAPFWAGTAIHRGGLSSMPAGQLVQQLVDELQQLL
ncbi:MAG: nitronate monooxygenase [Acinetobacter sp.]|nr:nitronate monooxygenase [Acinetobacter sp.]